MTRTFTPDEIAVICKRHFGWERATAALLARVFETTPQHITSILRSDPRHPAYRNPIRESGARPTGKPGATRPPAPEASGPVGRGLDAEERS